MRRRNWPSAASRPDRCARRTCRGSAFGGDAAPLAPFWDDPDLSAAGSGDVWYKLVDGDLVVKRDHVMRRSMATPVTFEIILLSTGAVTFQYLSVSGAVTDSATIGIQNSTRTQGLQVAYNTADLHDRLAVHIWLPKWASVPPPVGTIPPGGRMDLTLTFSAVGVLPGLHHGQLTIQRNDIARPTLAVPLTMEVKNYVAGAGTPRPDVVALAQNVPDPFNPETVIRIALPSGVYFYRLCAGGEVLTRRLTLAR